MTYIERYTKFKDSDLIDKGGVYIILNKVNNKYYIGGTLNFAIRFRGHISALLLNKHSNIHLQRAVNQYGIDNFEFDILEEYPDYITFSMESYWINILNTRNRELGYNLRGVEGGRIGRHSKESIEKMRGKPRMFSRDARNKMSISQKKKGISKEQRNKMIKGIKESIQKPVLQLDLSGGKIQEFISITHASIETGINAKTISANLRNRQKTCKGFIFIYKI